MVVVLLLLVIAILLFVYRQHGGDWQEAWAEVRDWAQNMWSRHGSTRFTHAENWVRDNRKKSVIALIVGLVLVVWAYNNLYLPALRPPQVDLSTWGEHTMVDNCGGQVAVWVIPAHEQPSTRIEIVPAEDVGKTISIVKPGSSPDCAIQLKIEGEG